MNLKEQEKLRILVVDDDLIRHEQFLANNRDYDIVSTYSSSAAISIFDNGEFDLICLDHDLGEDGDIIPLVKYIAQCFAEGKKKPVPILIHSMNPVGAANIEGYLHRLTQCQKIGGLWQIKDGISHYIRK